MNKNKTKTSQYIFQISYSLMCPCKVLSTEIYYIYITIWNADFIRPSVPIHILPKSIWPIHCQVWQDCWFEYDWEISYLHELISCFPFLTARRSPYKWTKPCPLISCTCWLWYQIRILIHVQFERTYAHIAPHDSFKRHMHIWIDSN